MCKVGCCAKTYCGIVIGLMNTVIMIGYFMGVIILETSCGVDCYDSIELLGVVLGGPIILYAVGYFLAWYSYKRGRNKMSGCNFCCILFWALLLLCLLGVMSWHAYIMINQHTYEYSDIYGGMVAGNVAYAALLCLVLCNVMTKEEKGTGYIDASREESVSSATQQDV